MNDHDIDAFIAQSRQVAAVQKQRWEGVDPTRLETACDLIEQLRRYARVPAATTPAQEAAAQALGWGTPAPPQLSGSQIIWRATWDVTQPHQGFVRLALADLQLDLVPRPQGVVSCQFVSLVLLKEP